MKKYKKIRKSDKKPNIRKSLLYVETFQPEVTLDYHPLGILDTFQIEYTLEKFIEDSYFAGKRKLLIITGKGSVIRPVVKKHIRTLSHIKSWTQAGYFNGGSGALEVELD